MISAVLAFFVLVALVLLWTLANEIKRQRPTPRQFTTYTPPRSAAANDHRYIYLVNLLQGDRAAADRLIRSAPGGNWEAQVEKAIEDLIRDRSR